MKSTEKKISKMNELLKQSFPTREDMEQATFLTLHLVLHVLDRRGLLDASDVSFLQDLRKADKTADIYNAAIEAARAGEKKEESCEG